MSFWFYYRIIAPVSLVALAAGFPLAGLAALKNEARVTQVVQDVQLLSTDGAAHPALVNESVHEGMTVRTGAESRVELTFADETVARLGANAVFNFKDGTRNLELQEGAMLLQAPGNAKGARIQTGGLAAAITGTTIVFESHPTHFKFLVLDGIGRLYRPGHIGDSVLVRAGQMVFGRPNTALSDPVDFDIGRFLKTSRFIADFPPLRSEALMASESQKQQREKSKKTLIDTNLVILGGGTAVSLVDPAQIEAIDRAATISSATSTSADLGTIETSSKPVPSPTPTPGTAIDKSQ